MVGGVLAAAVVVGGLVLWAGDGRKGSAQAGPAASPGASGRPEAGGGAEPEGREDAAEPTPGTPGDPSPGGPTAPPGELVPFEVLAPGECFDHPALSSDVREVETRSCHAPHNGEVIANQKLTGSFSDESELRAKVLDLCAADAAKRLGSMPADGRTYYYYAIYPSLPTYEVRGQDTVSCSLTLSASMGGPKLTAPLPD